MRLGTYEKKILSEKPKNRNRIKALKQRRKREIKKKFLHQLETRFKRHFDQNIGGLLLFLSRNIKIIMNGFSVDLMALDPRSRECKYSISDIVWTVILNFILNQESRNSANDLFKNKMVCRMIFKTFGIKLPHMDTCHNVMKDICPSRLRAVLYSIVRFLIDRKVLDKEKIQGQFPFLLDGTGIHPITVGDDELLSKPSTDFLSSLYTTSLFLEEANSDTSGSQKNDKIAPTWCTGKKSKNGVVSFHRDLVVLRCVGNNGISIVVDWEAINTEDGSTKEDCEHQAAIRLLSRFKSVFKRLKVVLVADALFTNSTFLSLVDRFSFSYIFTHRPEKLKSVEKQIVKLKSQESEIGESFLIAPKPVSKLKTTLSVSGGILGKSDSIEREYEWITNLHYSGFELNWCSLTEYTEGSDGKFYFSFLTNLYCSNDHIRQLVYTARNRNRVEDGFNTLKNRGSSMKHKYSRKSDKAAKNYITLLMVAEAIKSLAFNSDWTQRTYFKSSAKTTVKSLIKRLISALEQGIDQEKLNDMSGYIPAVIAYSMPKLD